eukprot:CAMPEP_0172717194 /NCGR_PEP_ID=MMETSP1074-20121228/70649_1 /TAXON_ID=2916 /ORGANISM="Ceratium fusus, Strain PA161109" /LENGTH=47 /DNA_ID= /DNA_START= /DNA_END= /DNA_ORIENTATION=
MIAKHFRPPAAEPFTGFGTSTLTEEAGEAGGGEGAFSADDTSPRRLP